MKSALLETPDFKFSMIFLIILDPHLSILVTRRSQLKWKEYFDFDDKEHDIVDLT